MITAEYFNLTIHLLTELHIPVQALKALVRLSERAGEVPSTEVLPAGASADGMGGATGGAAGGAAGGATENPFLAAPSWEDASAAVGAANTAVIAGEDGVPDPVAAAAGLMSAAGCVLRLKRLGSLCLAETTAQPFLLLTPIVAVWTGGWITGGTCSRTAVTVAVWPTGSIMGRTRALAAAVWITGPITAGMCALPAAV